MEFLLAIILVWALIFGFVSGAWKEKDIAVAKKAYLEALSALRRAPDNADAEQRAITLGRAYSALTRDKKGHAVFDEAALMRDIRAARGAAHADNPADPVQPTGTPG